MATPFSEVRQFFGSDGSRVFTDTAWAKVNLTLSVLGKRGDGYHELESLVVFAGYGDKLCLSLDEAAALSSLNCQIKGPEAQGIVGENLVETVSRHLLDLLSEKGFLNPEIGSEAHRFVTGVLTLDKRLPVAAGVGGGSADAAAAIRLIASFMAHRQIDLSSLDLFKFAARFGADIPVCLTGVPAIMRGIGEVVTPLHHFPKIGLLLVNPRVPVPTGRVFQELNAAPLSGEVGDVALSESLGPLSFHTVSEVIDHMKEVPNDLLEPALSVAPEIGYVLREIETLEGCLISRLSGSGATCFGLFETVEEAEFAAKNLKQSYPDWWVEGTFIRPL